MAKVMQIITPLGEDLLFQSLRGSEALGRLYEFTLTVLSTKHDIDPAKLLGKHVTVKLEMNDGSFRYFDGYATRFAQLNMVDRWYQYEIVSRPWMWLLTRTSDCRIFQAMKVPEILDKIFTKYPEASVDASKLDAKLYRKWTNCVQYRETDFNFVSRLMEQEGIYYHFKHEEGKHTLVLCDGADDHVAFHKDYGSMPYVVSGATVRPYKECIEDWTFQKEIQPGKYMLRDFNFTTPKDTLEVKTDKDRGYAHDDHEYFDYPGEYDVSGEGNQYVKVRLEELQNQQHQAQASTDAPGLVVGHTFKLEGHPRSEQNQEYLIASATYNITYGGYSSGRNVVGTGYQCSFAVVPKAEPFRPARITPKPIVQGPQTAIVVGPSGDEIYTDPDGYGMVKLHFHWDRHGKFDQDASPWIRVSQMWAGQNWGAMAIPRIGQEVIVDFLEGDPDDPIVSGRVYNADQMPPYALPANNTQTGIKSRSSPGGSPDNFNEIRFEDKKGSEQLFIHAEKNQDIEVENDETHWVGHDRKKTIDNDETVHVKHDRKETVGNNETIDVVVNRTETVGSNETITVGNNRSVTVNASETKTVTLQRTHTVGINETITVGGAQEVTIGGLQAVTIGALQMVNIGAKQTIDVGATRDVSVGAAQSVKIGANGSMKIGADESRDVTGGRKTNIGKDDNLKVAKNLVIDAGESVTIKTGEASIAMKKDGTISITGKKITIKGTDITVDGSGKISVKAGGDMTLKASKILQN